MNGNALGHDLGMDMVFNSPERFYRDIINESPVLSRTPQIGRTPLRNLNLSFSTPNFLKNMESTSVLNNSMTKSFTPLKNQLFNSNDLFQTPQDNKENTMNSSPTTIKMNSSAVKEDEEPNVSKVLPPSPTPGAKISDYKKTNIQQSQIPKMGCFKKTTEQLEPKPAQKPVHKTNNFQIIMTDVNSFANNIKPTKAGKRKKLARSSTVTSTSSKTITKKASLKRTMSQPQAKLEKLVNATVDPQQDQYQRQHVIQLTQGTVENVFQNGDRTTT
jgi:hypothetical protein